MLRLVRLKLKVLYLGDVLINSPTDLGRGSRQQFPVRQASGRHFHPPFYGGIQMLPLQRYSSDNVWLGAG